MRALLFFASILVASPLLAAPSPSPAAPRQEVSLNGEWQFQKVAPPSPPKVGAAQGGQADLLYPPPGEWKPMAVPGHLHGHNYERAWLRREFEAPAEMRGRRIEVAFGGVKWNSVVYLNGEKVGAHFGGYEAFSVDVTRQVRFDRPNELLVGVHDWTGVFIDRETPLDGQYGLELRDLPKEKILAPIGGIVTAYGIWDDVTLRAHPDAFIRDFFIKPSVRRKELVVDVTLANATAAAKRVGVAGSVRDGEAEALNLPWQAVTVPAGGEATVTLRAPWGKPRFWSHEDPYLYTLALGTTGVFQSTGEIPVIGSLFGKLDDEVRTRFGFRELWTQGPDFFFNGHKTHLLATSWWPPGDRPQEPAAIREWMEKVKRSHTFCFRTHTQPWPRRYYEIADEVGLLMIPEGAVWNDDYVYRLDDPRFWENYAEHLRAMVGTLKNHASVVMWSLENELYGGRMNEKAPSRLDLARMGRLMKEWDPTRPIMYESDGDPEGVADVIGLHYPHEYPEYTRWPNEADWMKEPIKVGHMFSETPGEFFWNRKKPLYIGEFLWVPSSNPSWHTVFYGDDAYRDYARYRNRAKGESWRMQILGYRRHEVSGISPWTMVEGGPLDESNPMYQAHVWAYRPVAAFLREYDSRFFSGEGVARTVDLYNDTLRGGDFEFSWSLSGRGVKGIGGKERIRMEPGAHLVRTLRVPMPEVKARTPLTLTLEVKRGRKPEFREEYSLAAFPRPRLQAPEGAAVGLYDPAGKTAAALRRLGLAFREVKSLEGLDPGEHEVRPYGLLVVGAGAFPAGKEGRVPVIGGGSGAMSGLERFIRAGGRVLVLEQEAYPTGLVPAAPGTHRSTMAFPLAPEHPALAGVAPEELKFWRGDHLVSAGELPRPSRGGGRALVASGSQEGLAHAPLLEYRLGRGALLLSQLLLVEKLEREPVAARLLQNCLDGLAAYRPVVGGTAVVAVDPAFVKALQALGLRFDDLSGRLAGADLSAYRLLVVQGSADALLAARATVDAFVAAGGNVLLHRPAPEEVEKLRPLHGAAVAARAYPGPVSPGSAWPGEHKVRRYGMFPREDLYWLGKHVGHGWATTPLATGMAEHAFLPALPEKGAVAYEAAGMSAEGAYAGVKEGEAYLASSGTITAEVSFPKAGTYVIGLTARGTPAGGVYPQAGVVLEPAGGKPGAQLNLGAVGLGSRDPETYTLFGDVPAGKHRMRITFLNDAQIGNEDRNFYLQRVMIAPLEVQPGTAFLTAPPALVRLPRGKGAWVFNSLCWDTEQANAVKADRLACGLLSSLGASFQDLSGVPAEAEEMEPDPQMPWFRRYSTSVLLAAAGYIEGPIEVARAAKYRLDVVARGTPAAGGYPIVDVLLDGKSLGQVELTGDSWRAYPLEAELPAGRHVLRLVFTNDLNQGGEDRNLYLDKVVFYAEGER